MQKESWVVYLILALALLYRALVALGPHSGYGKSPKFGDFEAQRHWMEITTFTPISQWYHNTTVNNLEYWGLDYPPLTAYHSWLCGLFAPLKSIELTKSRGQETLETRLFMRSTVLVSDLFLMLVPIVLIAIHVYNKWSNQSTAVLWDLFYVVLQPCIVLIDHGHFQYNHIAIGFTLWACWFLICAEKENSIGYTCLASALFCCSLNFKQMSLFYSLPFFCYLTGRCVELCRKKSVLTGITLFTAIGVTVLASFAIIWLPFLSPSQFPQVVKRIFPVGRGLFEDKVANIWCSISLVYKAQRRFDAGTMVKISSLLTLANSSVSCIDLLFRPTVIKFAYSLINVSLSFFLWGYHMHEKTILFVTAPASLMVLLSYHPDNRARDFTAIYHWLVVIGTFSMYPLLERDEVQIAYFASMIAYMVLIFRNNLHTSIHNRLLSILMTVSFVGILVIHVIMAVAPIPNRYPDLYVFMCTVYSCLHFIAFMIYCNYQQLIANKRKTQ